MNNNIKYFTIKEICQILHISQSSAARGLKASKNKPWTEAIRLGRRVLIPQTAFNQLTPYKKDSTEA